MTSSSVFSTHVKKHTSAKIALAAAAVEVAAAVVVVVAVDFWHADRTGLVFVVVSLALLVEIVQSPVADGHSFEVDCQPFLILQNYGSQSSLN